MHHNHQEVRERNSLSLSLLKKEVKFKVHHFLPKNFSLKTFFEEKKEACLLTRKKLKT